MKKPDGETPKISDEDKALFRETVKGTVPIPEAPAEAQSSTQEPLHLSDDNYSPPLAPEAILSFKRPNLPQKQFKAIQQGKTAFQDRTDLHGLTIDEARTALETFLLSSKSAGHNCVLIIHGKGSPNRPSTLKTQVKHWLQQVDFVKGFCSALPRHGGTGAAYVLL